MVVESKKKYSFIVKSYNICNNLQVFLIKTHYKHGFDYNRKYNLMEHICGVCGNTCTYFCCKCGTRLCKDCFVRITKDSSSPRCPHCHLVMVFPSLNQANSSTATRKLSRSDLYKMRVVQSNLVYVQGIPADLASEQVTAT